jgi:hypothetical protein
MPGAADEPDAATLAALQVALLRSVLGGEPLPGTEQAVVLPDLAFVLREQGVVLSAEHLAGEVPAGALPVAVRVLPRTPWPARRGGRGTSATSGSHRRRRRRMGCG